jgi:7-cyano-7-deazaguanine synthase in queuosine biosynthesis
METTLLCLSGGLDSALCAYKALSAGQRLHLHHIHLSNREGRQAVEAQATADILSWFRDNGLTDFTYTESSVHYGTIRFLVQDVNIWSYFIGAILADPRHRHMRSVIIPRNLDSFRYNDDSTPAQRRRAEARANERREQIVKAVAGRLPKWLYPIGNYTKLDVIRELPEGLRELCWWCRRPVGNAPCHRCHTCQQVDDALQTLEEGAVLCPS